MSAKYVSSKYPSTLTISAMSSKNGYILFLVTSPQKGVSTKITNINGYLHSYPYSFDGRKSGEVFITKLDTVQKIVSGHFSASVEVLPGDTVQITDGRFDMKLEIL